MKKIYVGLILFLGSATFGTLVRAEPPPSGSLTLPGLPGADPSDVIALPGGAIAFTMYAEDGSGRAVHVLDGATLRRTTILPPGRQLAVLDDTMIVAKGRGFDIYDAKTAKLLKH